MANHVPGTRIYARVAAALMVLLVLTILAGLMDIGPLNTVIAMVIAIIKAALVAMFFMHLSTSSPMMRVFASAGILWLVLLFGLTLGDYLTRIPEVRGASVGHGPETRQVAPPPLTESRAPDAPSRPAPGNAPLAAGTPASRSGSRTPGR